MNQKRDGLVSSVLSLATILTPTVLAVGLLFVYMIFGLSVSVETKIVRIIFSIITILAPGLVAWLIIKIFSKKYTITKHTLNMSILMILLLNIVVGISDQIAGRVVLDNILMFIIVAITLKFFTKKYITQ